MPRPSHLVIHGPEAVARHLPAHHPLKPRRADEAVELLTSAGLVGADAVPVVTPPRAPNADLARIHDEEYVRVADRLSQSPQDPEYLDPSTREASMHGFSRDGDNPPYLEMAEAARHACGGVIAAARHVLDHSASIAFVPAAGANHHAMRARASGFGVFNDAAVAIAAARSTGARVAYIDLDVHHGDGVEAAFRTDPDALTISLHESTRYLFPGPPGGLADQIGVGDGVGYAVNVPLFPYTDDDAWITAFDAIVPPLLTAFRADLTIVQCGADGFHADPLAHLLLTERAYLTAAARLRDVTGGRLVMIGGGGYDPIATPRIWASMFATFIGAPVPEHWTGGVAPVLDDQMASRVGEANDEAVATVQRLVFHYHRIDRSPIGGAGFAR